MSTREKTVEESIESSEATSRRDTLLRLKANGQRLYKGKYPVTHVAVDARQLPDTAEVSVAGRVMLFRTFGGLIFGHIQDRSGRIQFSIKKASVPPAIFASFSREVSIGDFLGVTGRMWTTNKMERTVDVNTFEVLSKAVRAMPDKWAGISDAETKQRRRYLDLLTDEDTRNRFILKSRMFSFIRSFLTEHDFVEVETPILQAAASGASARPFTTRHNALDQELYLRISPETYLKRLVAGSFERVFELGRNFRNEGIDPSHLQEFTMLEWYAAYWDYRDNMSFVQRLIQSMVEKFCGSLRVTYQGVELDFGGDWQQVDYRTAVMERTGIDLRRIRDADQLRAEVAKLGLGVDLDAKVSYGNLIDVLYKKSVRPHLIQPTFLMHHPVEVVPLARANDDDPSVLDMFQVVVNS